MRIEIIDLGQNNLSSVEKALLGNIRGTDSCISISELSESNSPNLLVLPGLGHFASGMEKLKEKGFDDLLIQENTKKTPIVGICLGMQLFCLESEEAPGIPGLGIVAGMVRKLPDGEPRPNTGWGELEISNHSNHFSSLSLDRDFYFVHSFHVELHDPSQVLTKTKFAGTKFVSSYHAGNLLGFQFHPEKSGEIGQSLISEIIDWAR